MSLKRAKKKAKKKNELLSHVTHSHELSDSRFRGNVRKMNYSLVKTLGRFLLKLETRSANGSYSKLILLLTVQIIPGMFIPFLLYKQTADTSGFQFTLLTFTFYSLIILFNIVSQLDNLVLNQNEAELYTNILIDNTLISKAKIYFLNRYIFLLSLPLLLSGNIFYYQMTKSILRSVVYFGSGLMFFLFLSSITLFIYSLLLRNLKRKISAYTLLFQIVLILTMVLSYQFISYSLSGKSGSSLTEYITFLQKNSLLNFLPPAWFAFLCDRSNYPFGIGLLGKIILPVVVTFMSIFTLKLYLRDNISLIKERVLNFSDRIEPSTNDNFKSPPAERAGKKSFLTEYYLKDNNELAAYGLMKNLYRSDKSVKLNFLPLMLIPVGLALFGLLTNQLQSPFASSYFGTKPVFHIALLITILVVLNTSLAGSKLSNQFKAAWIYDSVPLNKKRFINGVRKYYVLNFIIPLYVFLLLMFFISMNPLQALLHASFMFSATLVFTSVSFMLYKALPFSKDYSTVNSLNRITAMIFPLLVGIIITFSQNWMYKEIIYVTIFIFVAMVISLFVNYFYLRQSK